MIVQIKLLYNIYENAFRSLIHLNFKVHHDYNTQETCITGISQLFDEKKMFLVIEILQYHAALCLHARAIYNYLVSMRESIYDLDLAIFDSYNFLVLGMNDWIYKRHSPKHLKFCFVTIDFNFRTLQKISLYIWRINCVNWKLQTIQQFDKSTHCQKTLW